MFGLSTAKYHEYNLQQVRLFFLPQTCLENRSCQPYPITLESAQQKQRLEQTTLDAGGLKIQSRTTRKGLEKPNITGGR